MTKLLTLKDMVEGGGCTARTVRYYEREGLLRASRTSGGHRLFAPAELERLRFVVALREADWTLEEVAEILSIREHGTDDRGAARTLAGVLDGHLDRLARKIEVLTALRDDLARTRGLLGSCEACTVREPVVLCEGCQRVPALATLPSGFRLAWRAKELGGDAPFDDGPFDDAVVLPEPEVHE